MKIVKPGTEVFQNPKSYQELLEHIERCGRICYKSEERITKGSAEKFIKSIIARKHFAVLEHGNLIYAVDRPAYDLVNTLTRAIFISLGRTSYIKASIDLEAKYPIIISGNVRAFIEFFGNVRDLCRTNALLDAMGYETSLATIFRMEKMPLLFSDFVSESKYPSEYHDAPGTLIWDENKLSVFQRTVHCTRTVKFTCDRGVSHEIVRHRPAAYCQESTRYCNYSGNKFNGEISVIEPYFFLEDTECYDVWKDTCQKAEDAYFKLLDLGCSPQEARSVLPNSLKTEVCMSANYVEWQHFFDLRCVSAAHPQMREIATPLCFKFVQENPQLITPIADA